MIILIGKSHTPYSTKDSAGWFIFNLLDIQANTFQMPDLILARLKVLQSFLISSLLNSRQTVGDCKKKYKCKAMTLTYTWNYEW